MRLLHILHLLLLKCSGPQIVVWQLVLFLVFGLSLTSKAQLTNQQSNISKGVDSSRIIDEWRARHKIPKNWINSNWQNLVTGRNSYPSNTENYHLQGAMQFEFEGDSASMGGTSGSWYGKIRLINDSQFYLDMICKISLSYSNATKLNLPKLDIWWVGDTEGDLDCRFIPSDLKPHFILKNKPDKLLAYFENHLSDRWNMFWFKISLWCLAIFCSVFVWISRVYYFNSLSGTKTFV